MSRSSFVLAFLESSDLRSSFVRWNGRDRYKVGQEPLIDLGSEGAGRAGRSKFRLSELCMFRTFCREEREEAEPYHGLS